MQLTTMKQNGTVPHQQQKQEETMVTPKTNGNHSSTATKSSSTMIKSKKQKKQQKKQPKVSNNQQQQPKQRPKLNGSLLDKLTKSKYDITKEEKLENDNDVSIDYILDLLRSNVSVLYIAWQVCLASFALLDILSSVLPPLLLKIETTEIQERFYILFKRNKLIVEERFQIPDFFTRATAATAATIVEQQHKIPAQQQYDDDDDTAIEIITETIYGAFEYCIRWLREYDSLIGFLFALLWFIDVFIRAHRKFQNRQQQIDHDQLLLLSEKKNKGISEQEEENQQKKGAQQQEEEQSQLQQLLHQLQQQAMALFQKWYSKIKKWKIWSWFNHYWFPVITQYLYLPIGFHLWMMVVLRTVSDHFLLLLVDEDDNEAIQLVKEHSKFISFVKSYPQQNLCLLFTLISREIEKTEATRLFVQKYWPAAMKAMKGMFQVSIIYMYIQIAPYLNLINEKLGREDAEIDLDLWKPWVLRQRLKEALTIVRWICYLGPIFVPLGRLYNTFQLYLQRRTQAKEARQAKKIRFLLLKNKTEDEKKHYYCKVIQKTYRAHRQRKYARILKIMQNDSEQIHAMKLQKRFRAAMIRARQRLVAKHDELKQLEQEKRSLAFGEHMSDNKRKRMYILRDEIQKDAHELWNKKLLIRPTSKFLLVWNLIFACCVLTEVVQVAMYPAVKKYNKKNKKKVPGFKPLEFYEYLQVQYVPKPVPEWEQCIQLHNGDNNNKINYHDLDEFLEDQEQINEKLKDDDNKDDGPIIIGNMTIKDLKNKVNNVKTTLKKLVPPPETYCDNGIFHVLQRVWSSTLRLVFRILPHLVGYAFYFNMFVSFFVGEINPVTGRLQPKPFWKRYLVGVLLQICLYPRFLTLYEQFQDFVVIMLDIGPIRVYRWFIAFLLPFLLLFFYILERWIWIPLVKRLK